MKSEIPVADLIFMTCRYSMVLLVAIALGGGAAEAAGILSAPAYGTAVAYSGVIAAALWLLAVPLVLVRQAQRRSGTCEIPPCLAVERARRGVPERGIQFCRKAGLLYGAHHGEFCEHRAAGRCVFPSIAHFRNAGGQAGAAIVGAKRPLLEV